MSNIGNSVAIHRQLMDRLKMAYPDIEEADLLDTVEGETDLVECIQKIMRQAEHDARMVQGIKDWKADLDARKARLEQRIQSLRNSVLWAMEETGRKKLELPDMTLSVRAGTESVVIEDESAIPDALCETARKPRKADIKAALKNGDNVPGATLSNSAPALNVRKA